MYRAKLMSCFSGILVLSVLLTSCYHFESNNTADYDSFYADMSEKQSCAYLLPDPSFSDSITESYLYYSDRDLIDSFFTVYINCTYSKDVYYAEQKRLANVLDLAQPSVDDSFQFPVMVAINRITTRSAHCKYVLFDEASSKIIYVAIFEKGSNRKSINIPEDYLPKELLRLRDS